MADIEPKIMFDRDKHECLRHAVASMDTAIFAMAFFCSICGKQVPSLESSEGVDDGNR
jgi:hypothetical protein